MNEDYVLITEYNTLKGKYTEQLSRLKQLQNENAQLKKVLDEFNEVIKVNKEAKESIARSLDEINKKIESRRSKPSLQLASFSLSFNGIYDFEYIEQLMPVIESEYKKLLSNFKQLTVKYNVLYEEYAKSLAVNTKICNGNQSNEVLTNEKKTEDTNQTKDLSSKRNITSMCEGLCSMINANELTEPIPSIIKCLKKIGP